MHWHKDEFIITDNRDDLDIGVIHRFLRESYWARGISRNVVERSMANSLCFGLYLGGRQIGFARAIPDRATFAYLADVFILPDFRRRGLAAWLVTCIVGHPELQGLRRIMLATADAHGLYRGCGFLPLKSPDNFMEIGQANPYGESRPD